MQSQDRTGQMRLGWSSYGLRGKPYLGYIVPYSLPWITTINSRSTDNRTWSFQWMWNLWPDTSSTLSSTIC